MIFEDYFSENSMYNAVDFKRRYRMTPRLFDRISRAVCAHDTFFQQRRDAARNLDCLAYRKSLLHFDSLHKELEQTPLMNIVVWPKALQGNPSIDFPEQFKICLSLST